MVLSADIHELEKYSKKILQETKASKYLLFGLPLIRVFFMKKFYLYKVKKLQKEIIENLDHNADLIKAIMTLEKNGLSRLSDDELIAKLNKIKEDIDHYINLKEDYISKHELFEVDIIKIAIDGVLNSLYSYRNLLHKTIYKNKPVIATPQDLREGAMKMNSTNINRLLKSNV